MVCKTGIDMKHGEGGTYRRRPHMRCGRRGGDKWQTCHVILTSEVVVGEVEEDDLEGTTVVDINNTSSNIDRVLGSYC